VKHMAPLQEALTLSRMLFAVTWSHGSDMEAGAVVQPGALGTTSATRAYMNVSLGEKVCSHVSTKYRNHYLSTAEFASHCPIFVSLHRVQMLLL
jgi:hypothetical protein